MVHSWHFCLFVVFMNLNFVVSFKFLLNYETFSFLFLGALKVFQMISIKVYVSASTSISSSAFPEEL